MNLQIEKGSENYVGTIIKIDNLLPIEGADRIQYTTIQGNNVIISKDIQIGDEMIYYVSGSRLDNKYCRANNLYSNKEYNSDINAKTGYLGHKQSRVKAIQLRGIISNGFILPVSSLMSMIGEDFNKLKVGDTFNRINGELICEKYVVPVQKSTNNKSNNIKQYKNINRLIDGQFQFHNKTGHLTKNIHVIAPDDIIGVHYKKHGTSVCIANIPVFKKLNWFYKLLKKVGINVVDTEYDIIYSSRSVIKNQYLSNKKHKHFYGEDIWGIVAEEVGKLIPKNWTLYGEILGYTPYGSPIQKGYDYGCQVGEHKFYVYKISVNNPDGNVIYLTDNQIAEYCKSVGLLYNDTLLFYGRACNLYDDYLITQGIKTLEEWQNEFISKLKSMYEGANCKMCNNKVPSEGIVLRVESLYNYEAYKLKTESFVLRESNMQDKEEIDIEDIS